jgi:teichoic acid transport system permease protein
MTAVPSDLRPSGVPSDLRPTPAGLSAAELARRHGLADSGARPGLGRYSRDLWARRHFVVAFAAARVAAAHTTARLGQVWQVITPVVNAGVYFVVFGVLLGTHHGVDNFVAHLCTGVFVFTFTQQAVVAGTRAITDNLGLIRAVRFPRACLPLAVTGVHLQQLVLSLGVLAVIVVLTGEPVTARWLLVVPVVTLQAVFTAGLALAVARLAARTTDLAQLMPFVMRTWMYASGVFYHLGTFTTHAPPAVAGLLHANPMVVYIELMRHALITPAGALPPYAWPLAVGWALVTGAGGYVFFWQAEREYGRG